MRLRVVCHSQESGKRKRAEGVELGIKRNITAQCCPVVVESMEEAPTGMADDSSLEACWGTIVAEVTLR